MKTSQLEIQQGNRLAHGGRIDRSKPYRFRFNDRQLLGYHGDTLASALLANGVNLIGRSFKYGRPRGIMTAGVEEPNAIVQLGASEATQIPNVRATEQALYDGLVSRSVNGWPSVNLDFKGMIGMAGGALMSPGFYYKTFMFPKSRWETYEKFIRKAAGLGRAPRLPDPDRYEHIQQHTDVLVVGAGPAGLMAAREAAMQGVRVILADEQMEMGGSLLHGTEFIDGMPAVEWLTTVLAELAELPNVLLLPRATVNGFHDHNFLTIREKLGDHLADHTAAGVRQRIHKVRAASVVLATGAHERPLVFSNNDLPGCFTASAISQYIHRYAVVPGKQLLLMTSHDSAYQCAFDWHDSGRKVVAIVDTRKQPDGSVTEMAMQKGIRVISGSAIIEARGHRQVRACLVAPINSSASFVSGDALLYECDTIASSGGWSPAVHLSCHTGARPVWREDVLGFVPSIDAADRFAAGSINGNHALSSCLLEGIDNGNRAARSVSALLLVNDASTNDASTNDGPNGNAPSGDSRLTDAPIGDGPITSCPTASTDNDVLADAMPVFLVPHLKSSSRAPKQFVDMQNDVTAAGIVMSTREGFESIEHVKRYTAMGFGTDQGKTGNVNGMAIVAKALGQSIAETGTTVFRPNYTPVSFGVVAGAHTNILFDPQRFTPMHQWHLDHNAEFENVGQWKRAWYYPKAGESMPQAIAREQLATRNSVGILDASTLGKIDIQGADAREFLERVYTNAWAKLKPGRCRYGLMCGEDGMVMDDGVTSCLADNHFLMTTTTGGAAHVLAWLEIYHQTEWPELDVFFNSVTDQWATMSIAGPNSRQLLSEVCDIDVSASAFKFMDWKSATVAGVPARIFRISFTGDLSFEINVPAQYGLHVWKKLFEAGEPYSLTPYGTETMHVLRAEKGFIIVGQDTDGSQTPFDLDHGWAVALNKPFSFIGKRGMHREDCLRDGRKQLVGLTTVDKSVVLPEGAQAVLDPGQSPPMTMVGHVTSSYYSAFLDRSIALAVIRDGLSSKGKSLYFPLADGQVHEAVICDPVFVDADGARQKA